MRDPRGAAATDLRALLWAQAGRHGPRAVPRAELCQELERRHRRGQRTRRGCDFRSDAAPARGGRRTGDDRVKTPSLVLLVDDDAVFRQVTAGELRRLGFEVATAASGSEAVRKVSEAEPDVVLLDLRLPDMSGL
ncbi:MAG: response regulator, partial [Acidobacteria bacterium]